MVQLETRAVQRQGLPNKQQVGELLQPLADGLTTLGGRLVRGKGKQVSKTSRSKEDQEQPVTSAVTQHVAIRQVLRGEHQSETDRPPDPKQIFREQVKKERRKIEEKLSQEVRKRSQMMADLAYHDAGVGITRNGKLQARRPENHNLMTSARKLTFFHEVGGSFDTVSGTAQAIIDIKAKLYEAAEKNKLADTSVNGREGIIPNQQELLPLVLPKEEVVLTELARKQAQAEQALQYLSKRDQEAIPNTTIKARIEAYTGIVRYLARTLSSDGIQVYQQLLEEQRQACSQNFRWDSDRWTEQALEQECNEKARLLTGYYHDIARAASNIRVLARIQETDGNGQGAIDLLKTRQTIQTSLAVMSEIDPADDDALQRYYAHCQIIQDELYPVIRRLDSLFESSEIPDEKYCLADTLTREHAICLGFADMLGVVCQSLGFETGIISTTRQKDRDISHAMLTLDFPHDLLLIIDWTDLHPVIHKVEEETTDFSTINTRTGEITEWNCGDDFPYQGQSLFLERNDQSSCPTASYPSRVTKNLIITMTKDAAKTETSMQLAKEFAQSRPFDPDAQILLARMQASNNQKEEALKQYQRVIAIDPNSSPAHCKLALFLLELEDVDGATNMLEKALELDCENQEAYMALLKIYLKQEEFDKALELYEQTIAPDLDNITSFSVLFLLESAHLYSQRETKKILESKISDDKNCAKQLVQLAWELEKQGNLEKAREVVEKAAKLDPDDAEICKSWGQILFRQGKTEEAKEKHKEALEKDPDNPSFYYSLGLVTEQDDPEEACRLYQEAIDKNPQYSSAYNSLGNQYRKQKRYEEAKEMLQEAIRLDPKDPVPYINLAIVTEKEENLDRAREVYEQAFALGVESAGTHYFYGKFLARQGEKEEAREMYRRALEIGYASSELFPVVDLYEELIEIEEEEGNFDEVIELCQQATEFDPDNARLFYTWGNVLFTQGKHDEAGEQYRRVIELDPDDGAAYYNLADIAYINDDLHQASELYHKAIDLKFAYPPTYNNLGHIFIQQERLEEARTLLEEAIKLNSNYVTAYCNLALIEEKEGNPQKAIAMYQKVLEIDPDHAEAKEALGKLTSEEQE